MWNSATCCWLKRLSIGLASDLRHVSFSLVSSLALTLDQLADTLVSWTSTSTLGRSLEGPVHVPGGKYTPNT